jgi:hypothetical protein
MGRVFPVRSGIGRPRSIVMYLYFSCPPPGPRLHQGGVGGVNSKGRHLRRTGLFTLAPTPPALPT